MSILVFRHNLRMNDKYVLDFCNNEISHIAMQISFHEKNKVDVVLHCLIRSIEITDDAGILHCKQ